MHEDPGCRQSLHKIFHKGQPLKIDFVMNEDSQILHNGKASAEEIYEQFNFADVIPVRTGAVNSYGIDLSHPTDIKFEFDGIEIIVIGGVNDFVRTSLKVALKIQKIKESNSSQIYRKSVVDLLDEGQLTYCVREASARVMVESNNVRTALLDLRERLDRYRNDLIEGAGKEPTVELTTAVVKDVDKFLRSDELLGRTKDLIKDAGIPDQEMGIRLFILGLSRLTDSPLHVIVQGSRLIAHELFKNLSHVIPKEHLREATSISKTALTYAPYPDYWDHKTLLLHQLDAALTKGSVLEEYIREGQLSRIVTEVDFRNGSRKSGEKEMNARFGLMSYTSRDFLPIFSSTNVICLPLGDEKSMREWMYDNEIREFGGMLDPAKTKQAQELLINIQRHIKPLKIVNPYLDQLDLGQFFGKDFVQLRRFLHITSLITLYHQHLLPRRRVQGVVSAEVKPDHMLIALELFRDLWLKPEEEMYFRVAGTFNKIKKLLRKLHGDDCKETVFTISDLRPKIKVPFSTFSRHVTRLVEYGKIKKVGGNNKWGYEFEVADWEEGTDRTDLFNTLIKDIKQLE